MHFVLLKILLLPLLILISTISSAKVFNNDDNNQNQKKELLQLLRKTENRNPSSKYGYVGTDLWISNAANQKPSFKWDDDQNTINFNNWDPNLKDDQYSKEKTENSYELSKPSWYDILSKNYRRDNGDEDRISLKKENHHLTLSDFDVCKLEKLHRPYENEEEFEYKPRMLNEYICVYSYSNRNQNKCMFSIEENSEFCLDHGPGSCSTKFSNVTVLRRRRTNPESDWETLTYRIPNGCNCNNAFYSRT